MNAPDATITFPENWVLAPGGARLSVVQTKRGRPPVSALIRRDGRGSLRLDLWLPPAPPGAGAAAAAAALAAAAAASKAAAAETPSGEVPSIAPGASPEQRRLWFADLLFNRERAFFARLAAEAAAAIEASAPAWQVPVAALLRRLDELERAEKEQQQLQLRQQLRGVGISGGGPPPSSSSSGSRSAHQQGGSAGTAASSASSLGLGPFAWPRELCSTERNVAAAASAAVASAAADAAGAEAERADNADDAGASSALPGGQEGGDALGGTKSGEATATATTTTPSMALLLRAECLSHIPHMRVVSAQIGGGYVPGMSPTLSPAPAPPPPAAAGTGGAAAAAVAEALLAGLLEFCRPGDPVYLAGDERYVGDDGWWRRTLSFYAPFAADVARHIRAGAGNTGRSYAPRASLEDLLNPRLFAPGWPQDLQGRERQFLWRSSRLFTLLGSSQFGITVSPRALEGEDGGGGGREAGGSGGEGASSGSDPSSSASSSSVLRGGGRGGGKADAVAGLVDSSDFTQQRRWMREQLPRFRGFAAFLAELIRAEGNHAAQCRLDLLCDPKVAGFEWPRELRGREALFLEAFEGSFSVKGKFASVAKNARFE